jgi:hypothetical protein
VVAYSACVGALVPILILLLFRLERTLDLYVLWLRELAICLWPSWFLLGATIGQEYTRFGYTVLACSIILNVVLYSVTGALGFLVFTRLRHLG